MAIFREILNRIRQLQFLSIPRSPGWFMELLRNRLWERRATVAVRQHRRKEWILSTNIPFFLFLMWRSVRNLFRKFVAIVLSFWCYGIRIEQERLRNNVQACKNTIYEIKWEMSDQTWNRSRVCYNYSRKAQQRKASCLKLKCRFGTFFGREGEPLCDKEKVLRW